jgi:ribonuclease D
VKNNTSPAKGLLEQALGALPGDFALQGARSHILAALGQINQIEQRRDRRENTQNMIRQMEDKRKETMVNGIPQWQMSLPQAKQAIKNLDQMMQAELAKIDVKAKNDIKPPGGLLRD